MYSYARQFCEALPLHGSLLKYTVHVTNEK
jgi:hypothetical protein